MYLALDLHCFPIFTVFRYSSPSIAGHNFRTLITQSSSFKKRCSWQRRLLNLTQHMDNAVMLMLSMIFTFFGLWVALMLSPRWIAAGKGASNMSFVSGVYIRRTVMALKKGGTRCYASRAAGNTWDIWADLIAWGYIVASYYPNFGKYIAARRIPRPLAEPLTFFFAPFRPSHFPSLLLQFSTWLVPE